MRPDPSWAGAIAFHEMLFGTWIAYILLVVIWKRTLKTPLPEWKYLLLTCLASSFFLINRFFYDAPFYYWLANSHSIIFLFVWYWLGIRGEPRSWRWKCSALLLAAVWSALYVAFEMLARFAIYQGLHELYILLATYAGFAAVILWRRNAKPV